MDNFYKNLTSFDDFKQTFDPSFYSKAPSSWFVVITDIQGSTLAVSQGKYKEVNLIGAACIAAVNSAGDFPYVFGGDGSSFLINPKSLPVVQQELLKVKKIAKDNFSLNLRIGIVPVKDVEKKNKTVKIAKFKLAPNKFIAKFSGGGLELADSLIKINPKYQLKELESEDNFSLKNISCRWNPIKSANGAILTLIIKNKTLSSYKKTFDFLSSGLNESNINPVKIDSMKYKSFWQMIKEEISYPGNKVERIIQIIFCTIFFIFLKNRLPKFLKDYSKSMETHSDYRKFDDVLRMVIDCSLDEIDLILKKLEEDPNITFGYHISDSALMTCLVYNLEEGGHIHFIDGNNGGYTAAAKMMKNKIKKKLAS